VLRFVTTADTEILATAAAVERLPGELPRGALREPAGHPDPPALIDEVLDGARVVLCRVLGGRRGWPEGWTCSSQRCRARGASCSRSAARPSRTPR
jgi:cobaltochelatase CobN